MFSICRGVITRREHLAKTSKTPSPEIGHSNVIFYLFLVTNIKTCSSAKCLINGICGIFDMKSNHFGPVLPRKLKKIFEKLYKRAIKCKKRDSINRSKTTSL